MTTTRWIALLAMSMLLAGCGTLEDFLMDHLDTEPTHTPLPADREPPPIHLLHGDEVIPMDKGNYCWYTAEGDICVEVFAFPITYPEETHTPITGNTVTLLLEAPLPDSITAALHPAGPPVPNAPDITAVAIQDETGTILVTAPDDVNGSYTLVIFATWDNDTTPRGEAFYQTPIRFEPVAGSSAKPVHPTTTRSTRLSAEQGTGRSRRHANLAITIYRTGTPVTEYVRYFSWFVD
jgi:hypothetical protein